MKIKWYGHSCFLLTADNGARFLTDPCDPSVGYTLKNIETDAVTISHNHHDHSYLEAVLGSPAVYQEAGEYQFLGVKLKAIPAFHDEKAGAIRGTNLIFVFEIDGLTVVHLGDLGHLPDESLVEAIGPVDVLLAPIGGVYTLDAEGAQAAANLLKPKVLIPMHYKTRACTLDVGGVDRLLSKAQNCRIHKLGENEISLSPASLGTDRILIPDYVK